VLIMYKITEYWPNFVERSDEPRVAYVTDLEQLKEIAWLNKDGREFRCDGYFIRREGSPWIIALIEKL
jgi:hypothetical protein